MLLICHACGHEVAEISKDIKIPIQGSMFTSKDPKHGFPAPWNPVVSWEFLYCPMCQLRAFPIPDYNGNFLLKTTEGIMLVTSEGIFSTEDEVSEEEAQGPVADNAIPANTSEAGNILPVADGNFSGVSGPLTSGFDIAMESGDITKKGSWYAYKGKSYRKDDLKELLNGQ